MAATHDARKTASNTTSVADSYNTTLNRVANISNAGNVTIGALGGDESYLSGLKTILPYALGIVGIFGVLAFIKQT